MTLTFFYQILVSPKPLKAYRHAFQCLPCIISVRKWHPEAHWRRNQIAWVELRDFVGYVITIPRFVLFFLHLFILILLAIGFCQAAPRCNHLRASQSDGDKNTCHLGGLLIVSLRVRFVALIGHSPLGPFKAIETNHWYELYRLRIPTERWRPNWLYTSVS